MAGRVVSSFKGQTDLKDVRKRTVRVVCQVVQLERRLKNGWLVHGLSPPPVTSSLLEGGSKVTDFEVTNFSEVTTSKAGGCTKSRAEVTDFPKSPLPKWAVVQNLGPEVTNLGLRENLL